MINTFSYIPTVIQTKSFKKIIWYWSWIQFIRRICNSIHIYKRMSLKFISSNEHFPIWFRYFHTQYVFPINFYFPVCVCCQTMLLCDTYRNPRQWKKKWSQSEQIVDQSYFVSSSACLLGIINHHLPFPNIFCHHKFFLKNIINYLPSPLCACVPEQIEHIKLSFIYCIINDV